MRIHARPTTVGLLTAALTTLALLLVPATPAAAHNTLTSATPAREARLTEPPARITLRFMQKLNPAFTTIVLSDATARKVTTGEPAVSGTAGTVTVDESLANGTYTVAYRVVSADGHPVQGSYRFHVADPTADVAGTPAASTPTAEPSTTPAGPVTASSEHPGGANVPVLVGGGILLAAGVLAGTVVLLRRRRAGR
ncbi:copper resistance CopC family protein [Micromonospora sp. KC721]|uniref:copper resistance CopC family protein n=1 Tax=Micromonospora sp. KC721 TaxID=2530380 RepID=UPI001044FAF2|nr:copper resistance CopC family protein [Micromonospora sp. KC721]TDB82770.1 copper resistance protein CopC [Micromonospora sp. KC721]